MRGLLADPDVRGLTFSGGEPMAQAAALARVAELAREQRDLSVVSFTGYRIERLVSAGLPGRCWTRLTC